MLAGNVKILLAGTGLLISAASHAEQFVYVTATEIGVVDDGDLSTTMICSLSLREPSSYKPYN